MLKHSLNAKTRTKKRNRDPSGLLYLSAPTIWSAQHTFGQTIAASVALRLSDKG
jgi:hypothetical protein